MDPVLGEAKKLYASRFYQVKTGHGVIGTFLERIEVATSAECWWCGDKEQSLCTCTQSAENGGYNADFDERVGQGRDSMAETTRKKMISRAASKRAGSGSTAGIFERHRSR